jgi:UDP-N-acetylglucosamine 2-epimerase (non-hydrolysing)
MARGKPPEECYLFVAGTRPEAVKLAPVILALKARRQATVLVATGQHRALFDDAIAEFGLAADIDLAVMRDGQTPAAVLGALLPKLTALLGRNRPSAVIVQGDTVSAFAGALAASYARRPLAHVEAGLRSGSRDPFPEEMHRRAIAQLADLHLAPTAAARTALTGEGVAPHNIHVTGNTGIDALYLVRDRLARDAVAGARLARRFAGIDRSRPLIVATMHRRESHGAPLAGMLAAMADLASVAEVVIPVHPNPDVAGPALAALGSIKGVHLLPPLDYPAFIWLLGQATLAITDSGGVQEEAPALGVPVLVMRAVTERGEGIATGNARLVGTDRNAIVAAAMQILGDAAAWARMAEPALPYGCGDAAGQIAGLLVSRFGGAASAAGGSAQAFHHGDEARKAGGDRPGVVDGDGSAGVESQNGKAHGDAVIELGSHHGATGNGVAA